MVLRMGCEVWGDRGPGSESGSRGDDHSGDESFHGILSSRLSRLCHWAGSWCAGVRQPAEVRIHGAPIICAGRGFSLLSTPGFPGTSELRAAHHPSPRSSNKTKLQPRASPECGVALQWSWEVRGRGGGGAGAGGRGREELMAFDINCWWPH